MKESKVFFLPQRAGGPEQAAPEMGAGVHPGDRRLILLLGTARSGTSWLGTVLNTYEKVIYSHEPLSRLHSPPVTDLVERMIGTGYLPAEGRRALLQEWCKAHPECRRPPFFRKEFHRVGPSFQALAWLLVHQTGLDPAWYARWFTPAPNPSYDLLIKEIDWAAHVRAIVSALHPELLILVRHPCAVVASLARGQRLGLMPRADPSGWYLDHQFACGQLGFPRAAVLHMAPCEFLALNWLVSNWTYQAVLQAHQRGLLVGYERLCRDPLSEVQGIFEHFHWEMGKQTRKFLEQSTREGTPWWRGSRLGVRSSYFGVVRRRRGVTSSWRSDLTDLEQQQVLGIARCLPDFEAYWPEAAQA